MTPVLNSVLLVPPASEPVSLADAKAWLRIDTSAEDSLVAGLIPAARALVEAATRRLLMTQTWRLSFDDWPPGAVAMPLAPVASVAAVRVYDAGGVAQVVDSATWRLFETPDQARIVFSATPPTPGRAVSGIEIDVVAGYGAANDVPQALRQAMLMLIARWFENRGDGLDTGVNLLPVSVASLIAPFRRPRLA